MDKPQGSPKPSCGGDSQAFEFTVLRKPYRQPDLAKAFHALID